MATSKEAVVAPKGVVGSNVVKVSLSCPEAMPKRAHHTDGGADLCSMDSHEINPGCVVAVPVGVRMEIPYGYAGLVVPRSSMRKHGIIIANTLGLIDADYRGEIVVTLRNISKEPFYLNKFDRFAQIMLVPVLLAGFVEDTLSETTRGTGGFGSTGV